MIGYRQQRRATVRAERSAAAAECVRAELAAHADEIAEGVARWRDAEERGVVYAAAPEAAWRMSLRETVRALNALRSRVPSYLVRRLIAAEGGMPVAGTWASLRDQLEQCGEMSRFGEPEVPNPCGQLRWLEDCLVLSGVPDGLGGRAAACRSPWAAAYCTGVPVT